MRFRVSRVDIYRREGVERRSFIMMHWFVEINTLEELMRFRDEHGKVTINNSYSSTGENEIIIYKVYKE